MQRLFADRFDEMFEILEQSFLNGGRNRAEGSFAEILDKKLFCFYKKYAIIREIITQSEK